MLFGEEIDATTEDIQAVLSFQHKLLQEYLAAVYIAENIKPDTVEAFIKEVLPTWEKFEIHREVVLFVCGILSQDCVRILLNYVSKHTAEHMYKQLDNGKWFNSDISILEACQRECGLFTLNNHLTLYPSCRYFLAEVLANTQLVYIDSIAENDSLQLSPSPAKIIVYLNQVNTERYERLWQALDSMNPNNVIALALFRVTSANVFTLQNFSCLKYLSVWDYHFTMEEAEQLAESINTWGPQPQLLSCQLYGLPISISLMRALGKCNKLYTLKLTSCNLRDKVSELMTTLPSALRHLELMTCSLNGADVGHIAREIRQGKIIELQKLGLHCNPLGEDAVGSLLDTLVSTRPHSSLELGLMRTVCTDQGCYINLSEQFVREWERKLKGTKIDVKWGSLSGEVQLQVQLQGVLQFLILSTGMIGVAKLNPLDNKIIPTSKICTVQ